MIENQRKQSAARQPLLGIAPEGLPFIGASVALTGLTAALSRRLALLPLVLAGFTTYFFRDPERQPPALDGYLYAAADGKITAVEEIEEQEFIKGPAWRIVTFLSVFDVHINRTPTTGVIRYRNYVPGGFLDARDPNAGELNERHAIGFETSYGPVLVVQVAGLIARRIVCWSEIGEELGAGERFGLIRFGSRTDLIFPRDRGKPLVSHGARVVGGITPMASIERGS